MSDTPWKEAVLQVLAGEPEPCTAGDIAQKIVDQGLRTNVGATPANTVGALLSTSIKDEGEQSPFERVDRGLYRLRQKTGEAALGCSALIVEADETQPDAGLVNAFGMYWRRDWVLWGLVELGASARATT